MTTRTWTVVIVTLTLLVCGCSHAERSAVRATSTVGLTAVSPVNNAPATNLELPSAPEGLTAADSFPLPTEATTPESTIAVPETIDPIVVEDLPPLPLITPPNLRTPDGAELKMLGQTGLPLMLPNIPEPPVGASADTLVPVPTLPGHERD